ncbi:MAG TPA: hypothetical protein VMP11_06080 [Verrucomicrobiae bacterium]|nr:hypothetical protein [Verrucomicrobiae bacterium]
MRLKGWFSLGAVISIMASSAGFAQTRTFRSPAAFEGVVQDTDVAGKPAYAFEAFDGNSLVNLALGTSLETVRTNEVLALEFACDSSSVQLVAFDKAAASNLVVIATSSKISVVQQQGLDTALFPSRERFAAELEVVASGNASNGIAGGFIDVAGRVFLSPTNGCPRALRVDTDRRDDRICGDATTVQDPDNTGVLRAYAGRGHFHGAIYVIGSGTTNTVLVPEGALSIDRQLSP